MCVSYLKHISNRNLLSKTKELQRCFESDICETRVSLFITAQEVKLNILPLQPVQILPDVDMWRDFPSMFLLPKLEMTGRIRRVYDRKGNKQLFSKPRKSTSNGSLFLFSVIYCTQNSVCQCTLMDIAHK